MSQQGEQLGLPLSGEASAACPATERLFHLDSGELTVSQ